MSAGYRWRFLHQDTICACVPASLPIARNQTVSYDELKQYPILNVGYAETAVYRDIYQQMNLKPGDDGVVQVSSTDGATLLPLVGSGLGITFLSDSYLGACPPSVKLVPLNPPVHREIGIITSSSKNMTQAARSFIAYLKEDISG